MESEKCLDTDALILVYNKGLKDRFAGSNTTCISLFEFLRGISFLGKDVEGFKRDVEENFQILCLDNESILIASRIYAELRKEGNLIDDPDLIIGSICISRSITLVTNNVRHFSRLRKYGLKIVKVSEILS
ncbi:MAG: PIN domain nuclease [Metallosphaera javensis (ex Sakai et al. 2022)]|nr:MAG: PIN domain nuclease [Metallosphaera javensis (ex Sakai et al. 2022)]